MDSFVPKVEPTGEQVQNAKSSQLKAASQFQSDQVKEQPVAQPKPVQQLNTQPGFVGMSTMDGQHVVGVDAYRKKLMEAKEAGIPLEKVTEEYTKRGYTIQGLNEYQAQRSQKQQLNNTQHKQNMFDKVWDDYSSNFSRNFQEFAAPSL